MQQGHGDYRALIGLIQQASERCYAVDKGTIVGHIRGNEVKDYHKIKQYLTV